MTLRDFSDLYAFTEWANDRTLTSAETLDEDRWARDLGGSFPTLGGTLAHLVGAEWAWLRRWQGVSPTARPSWVDAPAPSALRAALTEVEAERRVFLVGLEEADLVCPLTYTFFNGTTATQPLGNLLFHVANHSTYHRGQAASMLRRLGAPPPPTDYLVYTAQAHAAPM